MTAIYIEMYQNTPMDEWIRHRYKWKKRHRIKHMLWNAAF
jgi:hypothetical protein